MQGMGVTLGDANAINGGLNLHDSHNVSTVNTVTNNVTNIAPQKSELELLQEKKNLFLTECKRAFEDGILEETEEVALEECRIKLGLDEATAKRILESVRLLSDRNLRKTSLNPIAKTKLKILSDNLLKNNVAALKAQIWSSSRYSDSDRAFSFTFDPDRPSSSEFSCYCFRHRGLAVCPVMK